MPVGLPLAAPDGPRARCVLNFLSREMRVSDALSTIAIAIIQPLVDASRGAALRVATVTSSSITGEGGTTVEVKGVVVDKALFDAPSGGLTKVQMQMMTEALQAADMQIFLRAAEAVAGAIREWVEALRLQCTASGWSEGVAVGAVLTSVSARTLCNQYRAYASEQQSALRILRGPLFTEFYRYQTFLPLHYLY